MTGMTVVVIYIKKFPNEETERKNMSKIFAVAALVGAAGFASANMVDLVEVDNGGLLGPDYRTFDLVVTVDPGDDWTSASATAMVDGVFYQDALGSDIEPGQALVDLSRRWRLTRSSPLRTPSLTASTPASPTAPCGTGDTDVAATWFDTPDTGDGVFTIARFSFTGDLWISGALTYAASGGTLFDYSLTTVPAPASIALLGLAGLIRRR